MKSKFKLNDVVVVKDGRMGKIKEITLFRDETIGYGVKPFDGNTMFFVPEKDVRHAKAVKFNTKE